MYFKVFSIVAVYFIIGAVALFFINKKEQQANTKERWTKYFVYLAIVVGMILSTRSDIVFNIVCSVILLIGFFELIYVWYKFKEHTNSYLFFSLILYALIAKCFMVFAMQCSSEEHLFIYAIVFSFDGFSQITGQLIGKHKLAPKISPGKTIEGLAGGLAAAVITSLMIHSELLFEEASSIIFTIIIVFVSLGGDLTASYYKRLHHTKDYNSLIPGHGGVLDRFDSFIAAGFLYGLIEFIFNRC